MFKDILVTGGAGFVGSSLAIAIRQAYPRVRIMALDNLRRRGSEHNLSRLEAAGVTFVHGDVRNAEDLASLPAQPGLILECSAEPSVLAGYTSTPEYLIRTNLNGCFECLELARRTSAHFIFVSTSRVYPIGWINRIRLREQDSRFAIDPAQEIAGVSTHGISEEFPLSGSRSLYGMTKLCAELMVEEYGASYRIPYIINRCGLLTGAWQMGKSDQGVIVWWLAAHYFKRALRYIGFGGSGKQVRDFLHIDDFGDLLTDQINHFSSYENSRFNVGGGVANSLSLREMTALCQKVTGNVISVEPSPESRPADIPIYITDSRRVSSVRGWRPRRDAETTFRDIHNWLATKGDMLRPVLDPQPGTR